MSSLAASQVVERIVDRPVPTPVEVRVPQPVQVPVPVETIRYRDVPYPVEQVASHFFLPHSLSAPICFAASQHVRSFGKTRFWRFCTCHALLP